MTMNKYQIKKGQVRQQAIDWQIDFSNHSYSWWDCQVKVSYFERLGKRYGLLKEFRENGII